MHYEGTPKDDEYVLGLRVLIRSIQNTHTPHDILVLLSSNVRESTRQQLTADGAILREVKNIENPFEKKVSGRNSYKARFVFSFNKLYLWDLTEYTRVIFLDSDNIFIDNVDSLFHCGHFCVVRKQHTQTEECRQSPQHLTALLTSLLPCVTHVAPAVCCGCRCS